MRLTRPSGALEASYRDLLTEIRAAGERLIPFPLAFPTDDFGVFLRTLEDHSRGIGLPEGFVPNSTFWLVDGDEVVGVSNLRHALTPKLRRGSIVFADNVKIFKNSLKPYVDYVRDPKNGFVTTTLNAGSGFEYSVYLPGNGTA